MMAVPVPVPVFTTRSGCVHNPIHIDEIAEYCPASGSSANSPLGEGLRVAAFCDEDKGAGEAGDEDPSRQKR